MFVSNFKLNLSNYYPHPSNKKKVKQHEKCNNRRDEDWNRELLEFEEKKCYLMKIRYVLILVFFCSNKMNLHSQKKQNKLSYLERNEDAEP